MPHVVPCQSLPYTSDSTPLPLPFVAAIISTKIMPTQNTRKRMQKEKSWHFLFVQKAGSTLTGPSGPTLPLQQQQPPPLALVSLSSSIGTGSGSTFGGIAGNGRALNAAELTLTMRSYIVSIPNMDHRWRWRKAG